jgi:S-adenosylmethionine hydrolase
MPVITILSDFGGQDEYVGVMKGVILSVCPSVSIVDITHQIDPQDIVQAAYLIPSFYRFFPEGTVHLIVVDPGVGSERDILAANHDGHFFIAPDNGVLTLLMNREKSDTIIRIRKLGTKTDVENIVHLENLNCRISETGELVGKIISIDRFGTLITNIDLNALTRYRKTRLENRLQICIRSHAIEGVSKTYANADPGSPLALIGSRNHLEIAVNGGSAQRYFKAHKGDLVRVR